MIVVGVVLVVQVFVILRVVITAWKVQRFGGEQSPSAFPDFLYC